MTDTTIRGFAAHVLARCFTEIDAIPAHLKGDVVRWTGGNAFQTSFLDMLRGSVSLSTELVALPEIKGLADTSIARINELLREHGFGHIQLVDMGPGIYAAAVQKCPVKWRAEGTDTRGGMPLLVKDRPAFRFDVDKNDIGFYKVRGADHVVVVIPPAHSSGDTIYLMKEPVVPVDLLQTTRGLGQISNGHQGSGFEKIEDFGGLIAPKIRMDASWDLEDLKGMEAENIPHVIMQAKMALRLSMNHQGAIAEAAASVGALESASSEPLPDYVIDQPFVCWFHRGQPLSVADSLGHTTAMPHFWAYMTEDCWNDPGTLTF